MVCGFLYGIGFGNIIVNNFFNIISFEVVIVYGYNDDFELFKMKLWYFVFWIGSGIGIYNFDIDFYQFVKDGKICVYFVDIECLEGDKVYLSNGEMVGMDIIFCVIGWKKEFVFKVINFDGGLK